MAMRAIAIAPRIPVDFILFVLSSKCRGQPARLVDGALGVEFPGFIGAADQRVVQTRIGHTLLGDGRKVRICRKCDGVVDK